MKMIFTILTLSACLFGCASTPPAPTTPMPTEELSAIGTDASKGDSYEVAFKNASKFCKRWGAQPSITRKEVRYQGQLTEGANTVINTAANLARAAGNWIPGVGSDDAYETTIFYKCY